MESNTLIVEPHGSAEGLEERLQSFGNIQLLKVMPSPFRYLVVYSSHKGTSTPFDEIRFDRLEGAQQALSALQQDATLSIERMDMPNSLRSSQTLAVPIQKKAFLLRYLIYRL